MSETSVQALETRPAPPSPVLRRAQQAYAQALWGMTHSALNKLNELGEGAAGQQPKEVQGEIWLWAGQVARLAGREALATQYLSRAMELLPTAAPGHGLAELLHAESQCATGQFESARARLVERTAQLPSETRELVNGYLMFVRGTYQEAIRVLLPLLNSVPEPLQSWVKMILAETHLDNNNPEAARGLLLPLTQSSLPDELFLRATTTLALVEARLALSASEDAQRVAARDRARLAAQYAMNVARYRVRAQVGEALSVRRLDPLRAQRVVGEAIALIGGSSYRLDEARLCALYELPMYEQSKKLAQPLVARGREILSRMGLTDRLSRLKLEDGEAAQNSAFLSASMALGQSMMGRSPLGGAEDDVELEAVFEATRSLSSSLKLEEVLDRILQALRKALKAERGVVLRRVNENWECAAAHGVDPGRVRPDGDEISFSVVNEAARTGAAVLADNAQTDQRFSAQASVMASEIRSVLCGPIQTSKGLYGAIYLDSTVAGRVFREHHRELLHVFCTQSAIAIENALAFSDLEDINQTLEQRVAERTASLEASNRQLESAMDELRNTQLALAQAERDRLEGELNVGRKIQQLLLPARVVHEHPGVRVFGAVEPAAFCAGDVWALVQQGDHRTFVMIGDVTGHGVGSSIVSAVAKSAVDTYLQHAVEPSPAELLSHLSQAVRNSNTGSMLTAFACLIDASKGIIEYSNAAHEHPVYVQSPGGLPELSRLSLPGVRCGEENARFEVHQRPFKPGEKIVLFTDGLTECRNNKDRPFGNRRLHSAVLELAAKSVQEMSEGLLEVAKQYNGDRPLDDDITVVALEFTGG